MRNTNLADVIADHLRLLIVNGRLASGERINESELSAELDVSRTPLREALSRLASERFVTVRARHGFYVQTLRPDEVRELYEIRGILDPSALELAGLPSVTQLKELAALNRQIGKAAGDVERIIELDDAWHRELLAHCPNGIVLALIQQFIMRTRPLERAYMAEHANVEVVVREHNRILAALSAGDLSAGVQALRVNMSSAIPVLVKWVEQQDWNSQTDAAELVR